MLIQDFTLDKYGWYVKVYYAEDGYPYDEIRRDLFSLGDDMEDIDSFIGHLKEGCKNQGSTHSNIYLQKSVIIIGPTTSAEEFQNTFDHEKGHLAMHICIANEIDPFSEEFQYLVGDIGHQMFKAAKDFLCDECRNNRDKNK